MDNFMKFTKQHVGNDERVIQITDYLLISHILTLSSLPTCCRELIQYARSGEM